MAQAHQNLPYSVYGPGRIEYGENVFVAEHAWFSIPNPGAVVRIGNNTQLGRFFTASCVKCIEIGAGCLIAERVFITDTAHCYEDVDTPIMVAGLREGQSVRIEDDVWIGAGAVILPGVTVGQHAVIGANAVVNRDVPARCVVAGNPARVVRRYNEGSGTWENVIASIPEA